MPSAPKALPDAAAAGKQQSHSRDHAQKKTPKKTAVQHPAATLAASTANRGRQRKAGKGSTGKAVVVKAPSPSKPQEAGAELVKHSKKKATKTGKELQVAGQIGSEWKLSQFIGGRYSDLSPVFSKDERHMLIAQTNQLRVFSTKTSLLVRTINIPSSSRTGFPEPIVGFGLDPRSDDRVYIATPSRIMLWNWQDNELVTKWISLPDMGLVDKICVAADQIDLSPDVSTIFVVCNRPKSSGQCVWRIQLSADKTMNKKMLVQFNHSVADIQAVDGGRTICMIANRFIIVIWAEGSDGDQWLKPRVIQRAETFTCMDVLPRREKNGQYGGTVVVGDRTGALYLFHDALLRPKGNERVKHNPHKMHWHRQGVESVKWALDGNYVISGGRETVLVLWQIETGHKQFLPHLGATVKDIVVSPRNTTYAISLADNSIMNISATELKATANIAGIQSITQNRKLRHALQIPCVLHPKFTNNLLVATPADQRDLHASAPYMQTFDTSSNRHISRQALTRTNATNTNINPEWSPIVEPSITALAISTSGDWLASVDEWHPQPSSTAIELEPHRGNEVFLKFWKWNSKRKEWDLVTRVDSPHPSPHEPGSESILDIITIPNNKGFATVGADGCVRIWQPKDRNRAGATTEGLQTWGLRKCINFSRQISIINDTAKVLKPWAAITFSEDASILAVASPSKTDSTIHLIDPTSGTILQTLSGLQLGRIRGISILGRHLILAGSHKLLLWNLVDGNVEWEYALRDLDSSVLPTSVHLAIDHHEQSFALAFSKVREAKRRSWVGGKILLFKPSSPEPVRTTQVDASIAALKAVGGGKGFMVLDVDARVQYFSPVSLVGGSGAAAEEVERRLSELYLGSGTEVVVRRKEEDVEMEDLDKEDVVPRQALERVFDELPTYAAGGLERTFDRVFDLFMKRPLIDDEEEEEGEEGTPLAIMRVESEGEDLIG